MTTYNTRARQLLVVNGFVALLVFCGFVLTAGYFHGTFMSFQIIVGSILFVLFLTSIGLASAARKEEIERQQEERQAREKLGQMCFALIALLHKHLNYQASKEVHGHMVEMLIEVLLKHQAALGGVEWRQHELNQNFTDWILFHLRLEETVEARRAPTEDSLQRIKAIQALKAHLRRLLPQPH